MQHNNFLEYKLGPLQICRAVWPVPLGSGPNTVPVHEVGGSFYGFSVAVMNGENVLCCKSQVTNPLILESQQGLLHLRQGFFHHGRRPGAHSIPQPI